MQLIWPVLFIGETLYLDVPVMLAWATVGLCATVLLRTLYTHVKDVL